VTRAHSDVAQKKEAAMGLLSTLLGHASDLTPEQTREDLDGILLPEESVEVAFKLIRDLFVFTDRRLTLLWQFNGTVTPLV
jgi:hypothetical protein